MPSMTRISRFLRVVTDEGSPNECALAANNNDILAVLSYYPPWRQWVMIPEPDTVWSHDCLEAVRLELVRRNKPAAPGPDCMRFSAECIIGARYSAPGGEGTR